MTLLFAECQMRSMSEKLLHRFDHSWQAFAVAQELENHGLKSRSVARAKEYTSLLVGGSEDPVDLFINEAHHQRASEILSQFLSRNNVATTKTVDDKNYFKRTVLFSLFGVLLLPIIFNVAATLNYLELKNQKVSKGKTTFALAVLLITWVISLLEVGLIFRNNFSDLNLVTF